MKPWPFADPETASVITLRDILDKKILVLLVGHEKEDDGWLFLDGRDTINSADTVVVTLKHVFELDPSVGELADLPCGWRAWREASDQPWQRVEVKTGEKE